MRVIYVLEVRKSR